MGGSVRLQHAAPTWSYALRVSYSLRVGGGQGGVYHNARQDLRRYIWIWRRHHRWERRTLTGVSMVCVSVRPRSRVLALQRLGHVTLDDFRRTPSQKREDDPVFLAASEGDVLVRLEAGRDGKLGDSDPNVSRYHS